MESEGVQNPSVVDSEGSVCRVAETQMSAANGEVDPVLNGGDFVYCHCHQIATVALREKFDFHPTDRIRWRCFSFGEVGSVAACDLDISAWETLDTCNIDQLRTRLTSIGGFLAEQNEYMEYENVRMEKQIELQKKEITILKAKIDDYQDEKKDVKRKMQAVLDSFHDGSSGIQCCNLDNN